MYRVIVKHKDSNEESVFDTMLTLEDIKKLIREFEIEKYETAMLSESSLAKDWLRPEEDEAWQNL